MWCNSYKSASKYQELKEMLESGAIRLLKVGEVASATELATLLLDHYQEFKETPSQSTIDPLLHIFAAYKSDETHPSKEAFVLQASTWSKHPSNNNQGAPELHTAFARDYASRKDYNNAQKHFLRSDDMDSFAKMCVEWAQAGLPGEADLFFTRPTLMLLALGNLKMANSFFSSYTSLLTPALKTVPLFNFCRFLLMTLERDALTLFQSTPLYLCSLTQERPNFRSMPRSNRFHLLQC